MTHKHVKQNRMKMLKEMIKKILKHSLFLLKAKQAVFFVRDAMEILSFQQTHIFTQQTSREKYFFFLSSVEVSSSERVFFFIKKNLKRKTNFKTMFVLYNTHSVLSFLYLIFPRQFPLFCIFHLQMPSDFIFHSTCINLFIYG